MAKGEITCFEQILPLLQCFQKSSACGRLQKASICGKGLINQDAVLVLVKLYILYLVTFGQNETTY